MPSHIRSVSLTSTPAKLNVYKPCQSCIIHELFSPIFWPVFCCCNVIFPLTLGIALCEQHQLNQCWPFASDVAVPFANVHLEQTFTGNFLYNRPHLYQTGLSLSRLVHQFVLPEQHRGSPEPKVKKFQILDGLNFPQYQLFNVLGV